jgi:hypothetical protein
VTEHHHDDQYEQGVMLDVGPGAGALVIYTAEELHGEEIEISPTGNDAQRVHTEVLRRRIASGNVWAAVFGSLAEGDYRLWHKSLTAPREVRIVSEQVTELDWR